MKEKAIENEILSWLKLQGLFCWKVESQGTYDAKKGIYRRKNSVHRLLGVSDIIGLLPNGRLFACEVKSKTGRLSEHQKLFLENINANGGVGFVARSIGDVDKALEGLWT
jgi:penicillin-binding protein-related factor A (putative recombinase)